MSLRIAKNAAISLVAFFLVGMSIGVASEGICGQIARLPARERNERICEEIRQFPLAGAGKCLKTTYTKREGGRAKSGLRLVANSSKVYCSEQNGSGVLVIEQFDGQKYTNILHHPGGAVRQVLYDCRPFRCPPDFWMLAWVFDLRAFRNPSTGSEIATNIEGLCQRVLDCQTVEITNHERHGEVVSCVIKEKTRKDRFSSSTFYFGERNGFLVLVGAETMSQAPYTEGKWLLVGRQNWWIEYEDFDSLLIPKQWGRTIFQEQREYDGRLKQKANVSYDVRFDVSSAEMVEVFPDEIFKSDVPANAVVRDMCVERRENGAAFAKIEEIQGRGSRWIQRAILFLAVTAGIAAFVTWKRKS